MSSTHALSPLADLEPKAAAGEALSRDEAARVLACPDLVAVGMLAESARKARHGERVTYGRVLVLGTEPPPAEHAPPGEVRLVGRPASIDDARARVRAAHAIAAGMPLTGFSLADLMDLVGGDHLALADLASSLRSDGLDAVAEVPIDRLGDTENAVEVVRAVTHGGLGAWRATVERAGEDPLDLVTRAAAIQLETSALRAFAPLARIDSRDSPSTGYDDVKLVAVARLFCASIASMQVDWPMYGPKLAQVAIAFGADDIDGIAVVDALQLGLRRSPVEDIERQIRSAGASPAERTGRFELRP